MPGDAIQLNKIRTICRIALLNGHDSIVLAVTNWVSAGSW